MKIATSVQPPSLLLRERLQQVVPKPTFNLGKSKFYQNHLITLHDPAAPLQKQLPSGPFFNSLLHLSQQHHDTASILFTTGDFSLHTILQVSPSFLVLPTYLPFIFPYHPHPQNLFGAAKFMHFHSCRGLWLPFHREIQGPRNTFAWHQHSEEQMSHAIRHTLSLLGRRKCPFEEMMNSADYIQSTQHQSVWSRSFRALLSPCTGRWHKTTLFSLCRGM